MRRALVLLAACGRSPAPAECRVELAGNVVESSASPTLCPKLVAGAGATQGDRLLTFAVPSRALGTNLSITIDLGARPTPGIYTAGTTAFWSAAAAKPVPPAGACMFLAGNNATPTGTFALELTTLDAATAHGTLALTLFILPRISDAGVPTDCGRSTTEDVRLRF
jgi:hypothetical protein